MAALSRLGSFNRSARSTNTVGFVLARLEYSGSRLRESAICVLLSEHVFYVLRACSDIAVSSAIKEGDGESFA